MSISSFSGVRSALFSGLVVVCAVDAFSAPRLQAQVRPAAVKPVVGFATVRGSVADRFGGPLSGVDVVLTNDASGERRTSKTAADATFEFANLPGGQYSLEVWREGFARSYRDVRLRDEEHSTQTLTMQVDDIKETLRVVAGKEPPPPVVGTTGRESGLRPSESPRDRMCGADGSGCVVPARKVGDVRPQYPASASTRGIEGIVIAEATIDEQGAVSDVRVVRSVDDQLDESVVEAVGQWQFVPTTLNGTPTPSLLSVTVEFVIAGR